VICDMICSSRFNDIYLKDFMDLNGYIRYHVHYYMSNFSINNLKVINRIKFHMVFAFTHNVC
jgi:uncharacterized membrane protein YagU involved in acid resistance